MKTQHEHTAAQSADDMAKVPSGHTAKRVARIVGNVLLYTFLAFCILTVAVTILSKRDADGTAEIFGYQMRVVTSPSMEACEATDVSAYEIGSIPVHSMVFVQTVPDDPAEQEEWYGNLKVGDVLTFRYVYANQVTITHRILSITPKENGGYRIELAGDNKNDTTYGENGGRMIQIIDTAPESNEEQYNYVIGKVTAKSFLLGAAISALKTPIGIVLLIIVPCFLIILWQVLKIVQILGADKKKREQEQRAQQERQAEEKDNELEALRRKVAELEEKQTQTTANAEEAVSQGKEEEMSK